MAKKENKEEQLTENQQFAAYNPDIDKLFDEVSRNDDSYSDTLSKYLKSIRDYKVMDKVDELEVAKQSKTDQQAFETLVNCNLRYVISIAKKYRYSGVPFEDLIQEGNKGLTEAARKFDYTKGYRLISYADSYIKKYILNCIRQNNLTHIPEDKYSLMIDIKKYCDEYRLENGNVPTNEEIATKFSLNNNEVEALLTSDSYVSLSEVLFDDEAKELENVIGLQQANSNILGYLENLTDFEKDIVISYLGLDGHKQMTFEEIGEVYGITKQAVSQRYRKIINKLKDEFYE